jgi:UDP:flavonoid glycosyltransferase YjiC (YdhE family)
MPVRVLLTLGPAVPVHAVEVPANVTVRAFVPHDVVLPQMAGVVTHAGLSTVTSALAHGVPMVCIPQGREQPLNAARVEAVGAGRALEAASGADQIEKCVDEVLNDPAMRASAARFADLTRGLGAGSTATDMVESLAW